MTLLRIITLAIFTLTLSLSASVNSIAATTNSTTDSNISGGIKYEGSIGEYAITMYLTVTTSTQAGDMVGYYYYNDRPKSIFKLKAVRVVSKWVESGGCSITLKEYTAKGNNTGTFNGFLSHRWGNFNGTFTNRNGKKYNFAVEE